MNREAVLLGVPVYSIFSGKLGSIDAQMELEGRITFVRSTSDVNKIRLVRRGRSSKDRPVITDRVETFIVEQINSFLSRA
jgi:predicted glycosyltransferase